MNVPLRGGAMEPWAELLPAIVPLCYNFWVTVAISDIGRVLAERRRSLKLTQADVARRLGSSQSYVAQIERGARRGIRWPTIVDFARALDLEPLLVPRNRLNEIEALLRTERDDEIPPLVGDAWSDDE